MLITMLITLYTSRIVLQNLGVIDYGIFNVVNSAVFLFMFLSGAMSEATQRFIVCEIGKKNKERLHEIFINCVNLHLCVSCIVVLLCETIGLWFLCNKLDIPEGRFMAAMWIYQVSIVTAVITIMSIPYNAIIVSYEKMTAFAYISIIEVSLKLAVAFIISVVVWDKLIIYAVLFCITQLLVRLVYNSYCIRTFEVARYRFSYKKSILKEMGAFASWYLVGSFLIVMNNQGVKMMLNIFFGPIANAAFGIGEQIQNAFTQFRSNLQMAINPQITKTYAVDYIEGMRSLIYASIKYSYYIFWIIALPIFLQTNYILHLWLKVVPEYSVEFVRLLLLVALIQALQNPLAVAIGAIGQLEKITKVRCFFSFLVLPLSYLLLKNGYPITTPLFLYISSMSVNYIVSIVYLDRKIDFKYWHFIRTVIVPILVTSVCSVFIVLVFSIYVQNPMFNIGLSFLVSSIVIYFWGLNIKEKMFVTNLVRKYVNVKNA